jgi:hypothetical protein
MEVTSTQDNKFLNRETVFIAVIIIGITIAASYRLYILASNQENDSDGKAALESYKNYMAVVEKSYYDVNPETQFSRGTMYYKGEGVRQDYKKAVKWFTKAAEQGHTKSQFILALMYYDGEGVIEDYEEAYKWALIAGMNGEDVSKLKEALAARMTPAKIANIQKLTKDFVAKSEKRKDP